MSDVDCHRNTPESHALHPFTKLHVQRTFSANLLVVISLLLKCKDPVHVCPWEFIERMRAIKFSDIPIKNSKNGTEYPLPWEAVWDGVECFSSITFSLFAWLLFFLVCTISEESKLYSEKESAPQSEKREIATRLLVAAGRGGDTREDLPVSESRYLVTDLKSILSRTASPELSFKIMKSFWWKWPTQTRGTDNVSAAEIRSPTTSRWWNQMLFSTESSGKQTVRVPNRCFDLSREHQDVEQMHGLIFPLSHDK